MLKRVLFSLILFTLLLTGTATGQASRTYKVGEKISVRWHGQWFAAEVVEVGKGAQAGKYYIRYMGYDASWNEYVGPDRIEPVKDNNAAGSAQQKGRAPTPAAAVRNVPANKAPARSPVGRYVCQSFNWQTNLLEAQGEFVLNSNGTYRDVWNKQNGSWTYDAAKSTFRFTGVLNNGAQAVYRPDKHNGMIVFDWGNGVKRECYCQVAAK